jgi:hypothetical protein
VTEPVAEPLENGWRSLKRRAHRSDNVVALEALMTNLLKTALRLACLMIVTLVACLVATGCGDNNGPTAPVSPTPAPIPNVAGNWQGRFQPGVSSQFFACGAEVNATAALSQDGSHVTGTVTTQSTRLNRGTFTGEAGATQIRGSLVIGDSTRRVTGAVSANRLTMSFASDSILCGTARLEFNR